MAYLNRSNVIDYYKILGIEAKASDTEIKKAYRKNARSSHPDKCPNDPKAAEKFMKIKEAYDLLIDKTKRLDYDSRRSQSTRDHQRWTAYQAHYNQWSAPKTRDSAQRDEDEWEALNRGEAYYTQWMKDKMARKQQAQRAKKKNWQTERQRLLREWEDDQKGRYQRTLARLKLIWDPLVDIRQNPRHLKNYLWAMTVMCPQDAPPGVAIAEFRNAREAMNAERLCRRYKPQPIEVEWLTTKPTVNQPPPRSYFDSSEYSHQGHNVKETEMNPDLEPEKDLGFGVGKKPTDFTKDDVIIIDSMGCSFGTKTNPIVIDDTSSGDSKNKKNNLRKEKREHVIEIDDDKDEKLKFEKEKKIYNEKLFDKIAKKLSEEEKAHKRRRTDALDHKFQEEVKILKEKQGAEKLAAEIAEKQRQEKLKRNAALFETMMAPKNLKKTKKNTGADSDFLAELESLKQKAKQNKSRKTTEENYPKKTPENVNDINQRLLNMATIGEPCTNELKKSSEDEKEKPTKQPSFKERLELMRAKKEAEEKTRLDIIASSNGKTSLDKSDLRLLFSQKW